MRLIDADALKEVIFSKSDNVEDLWDTMGVLNAINNAPTVEVTKPKGEWHHSGECSVCHKRSLRTTPLGDIIGIDLTDFCKNCGADMRGENNDT